ncbi:YggT family protein [Clostridium cochlearium]|uniref:YggT family protein n=2 Tax=Clostridium cochlearium TaxID=1494 RepID=UPI002F26BE01
MDDEMRFTLIRIFNMLFNIMEAAILIDIVLSFIGRGMRNSFTELIKTITEPLLAPGRRIQEMIMPGLMIDFSPILAFFLISIMRRIVFTLLIW